MNGFGIDQPDMPDQIALLVISWNGVNTVH